ncbi:MAG: hypothetical protein PF517_03800 [Salinivirgaceae bacterium]|jgi:hypothetical protein|nr:hypothetical protein [Salinivirgaceae bacterium]
MGRDKFNTFIIIKIQALVAMVMERKSMSFEDALYLLYNSKTYSELMNEGTKVWHFSTPKLFEILDKEYVNNIFSLPDYV